ncbi:MAG: DinB family protein [Caldilineales bacterium]|nr:DinB family protein [Caldilineales bacterium]
MNADQVLRDQLLYLLRGGGAHMSLSDAIAGFPAEHINTRPPGVPYSFWHLLEHIRIAQWDILDFIRNPDYVYLAWPADYWPAPDAEAAWSDWEQTIAAIASDNSELQEIVLNPNTDLYSDLPHASGYTILREILLVCDHNAYHIGEFGILRQTLGLWPDQEG